MKDKTQPEAGSTHIIRYALELGLLWIDGDGRDKVREALDALDILEAQLEAIGAGGVSGPLMGRASLAANAGSEPAATVFTMEALAPGGGVKYHATVHKPLPAGTKLYLQPSPPAGRHLDPDGEAFRKAARLGLTLRFYGSCAQSSMPGTPSAYVVTHGGDRAEAMREAVEQAAAIIASGGEAPKAPLAPPAEQQAMESVLVDGAASQPPISNTLWRMLTGGYEHTYILQLPNDSRDRRELIDRACHNWRRICAEIGNSAVASAVSPQTAQAPQQEASQDTMYLLRRLLSNQHTLTGPEFRAELEKIVGEAYQQEAQEPVLCKRKAFESWARRQPWIKDCGKAQDGDAYGHWDTQKAWLAWNAALAAPQPAPAPLSDDTKDAARYRWLRNKSTVLHGTAWLGSATAYQRDVDFLRRDDALAALDAAIDAALAAQGGTP